MLNEDGDELIIDHQMLVANDQNDHKLLAKPSHGEIMNNRRATPNYLFIWLPKQAFWQCD